MSSHKFKSFGFSLVIAKSPSVHDPLGVIRYAAFLQIGMKQWTWNIGHAVPKGPNPPQMALQPRLP